MKRCTLFTMFGMMIIPSLGIHAQQEVSQPKGKPIITLFGDAGAGVKDSELSSLGFNLERAYIGYEFQHNSNWKTKVVYDMGKGEDQSLQRLGYLKNAELDYKTGNFDIHLGLTSTSNFNFQEKFWGYRYVYKSFQDQNKWSSSADLGLLANYKFGDWISADLSVFNGEGYKKIQSNKDLQYGLGITITPIKGLSIRCYGDIKTAQDTVSQNTLALFAGYKGNGFRLGAEYNMQINHGNSNNHQLNGFSIYGTASISSSMEIFARYDFGNSSLNDEWKSSQDGQLALLGLHYKVNDIFSFSPNVRYSQSSQGVSSFYACVSMKVNL